MSKLDPESLEEIAQSWRDYVAEKEKAALVEASQPKVPLPDKSQSKPAALRRPGKVRHKRSSSTSATVGYPRPHRGRGASWLQVDTGEKAFAE